VVARRALVSAFAILLMVGAATPSVADEPFGLRQLHVIVAPDGDGRTLHVVEIAILENPGTAPVDATVRFPLPADAYDLELGAGYLGRSAAVPGGIEWSGALPPGGTDLVLGYSIDYGGAYVLRKLLPLPAAAVDVMVEDVGVTVASRELSGPVPATAGEARFLRLSGRNVPAGAILSVEIRGALTGRAPATPAVADLAAPIGLVLLMAATAFVLIRPRLRRRAPGSKRTGQAERPTGAPAADEEVTEEQLEEGALA